MELKLPSAGLSPSVRPGLLIVPYGIETAKTHGLRVTTHDAFNRTLWN